ncbi:hypothetical protein BJ165DRAFT_434388 [Panaeolus papilionaceus]|nr:hypothetical protein BJ165DRAFT_434388 [Panaeolus papilionaceus]
MIACSDKILSAVFMPKPIPAPPQISNSVSFPSTSYQTPGPQSIYSPQEAQQRQAALTQSTLARLKKLNLRNYAAPNVPSRPHTSSISSVNSTDSISSTSTSSSHSTVTSTDSTPLHTPILEDCKEPYGVQLATHDPDTNLLGGNGSLLSRRTDSPAVQSLSMHLENGFPATYMADRRKPDTSVPSLPELGSSPPFSDMSGIQMAGATRNGKVSDHPIDSNASWSWGSFTAAAKSAQDEDEVDPTSYQSHSRSSSGSGAPIGMGAIAPPQRRRPSGASAHTPTSHNGHGHHEAGSKGSDDSSSGSGSDSRRRSANATPTPTRPMSPISPPASPRRVWAPLSTFAGGAHVPSPMGRTGSPMGSPAPSPPPSNLATPTGTTSPASPKDDAVYQAFVRQWCFAQGPAPSPGPGASMSTAESTPEKRLAVN